MEKMPESSPKRMWALRLTEDEKQMLQECANASSASLTDMVRWLIRQYHQQHVRKPAVQRAPARTATKR
jgi:uncharacterized protein (DUF1778 family)